MYGVYEEMFDAAGVGIGAIVGIYLMGFALGIAFYVMSAMSIYSISKRRGINHAWMAWFPIVDYYQLGCISDQYHYVTKGENRSKRKALLVLNIILTVVYIAFFAVFISMIVGLNAATLNDFREDELVMSVIGGAVGMVGLYLVMFGVAIALTIVRYIALYDLYASCNPDNKVLFLVFSIIFSVTEPFFLIACRKKDLGMPPRRTQQIPGNGWQPQQPQWQQPAQQQWQQPQQNTWQQPAQQQWQQPVQPQQPTQPAEPWENKPEN